MITNKNPWLILIIVSSGLFLVGIDMTVLNVALPVITHELNATNSEKLWMINTYSLVMAGLIPGFGTLSDKIGHKKMFSIGLVIFGLSSIMASFSTTPTLLIIARGFLAVGAAIMLPATIAIIRVVFIDDNQRAIAIGIWGSVSAGASALGPIIGGVILEHFWWGAIFLINVPIVLLTLIFTVIKIPAISANYRLRWDFIASIFLTISLVSMVYMVKSILQANVYWIDIIVALITALSFLVFFIQRQKFIYSPIIDFSLFSNIRFSIGIIGAMFASFIMIGLQFVLSQELQLVRSWLGNSMNGLTSQ